MGCYLEQELRTDGVETILEGFHMNSIVYLVGAVVIIIFVLKLVGLY